MNKCDGPGCDNPTKTRFCGNDCRKRWQREFVIGHHKCTECQESFPYTYFSKHRETCGPVCREARRLRNSPARLPTMPPNSAPPRIRQGYCTHNADGELVRCAIHRETCGAGCLRTEGKTPVCRVEPVRVGSDAARVGV